MASSTFTFVDQNGQPVWGLATRISRGHGDTNKAEDERYPDKSGKTTFLEVKLVLPSVDGHSLHINYNEGLNPNWADYLPLSKHFSDIEDPAQIKPAILILKKGSTYPSPPTGNGNGLTTINCPHDSSFLGCGTTQEWKVLAHKLAPSGIMEPENGSQPNLDAFDRALRNVPIPWGFSPCQLQFTSGNKKKPRIHLPVMPQVNVPDCGMYSRVVDIGDFGFPFFHNSTSTDEWQLTGRPPGSKW